MKDLLFILIICAIGANALSYDAEEKAKIYKQTPKWIWGKPDSAQTLKYLQTEIIIKKPTD